jgi:hypothetical protein
LRQTVQREGVQLCAPAWNPPWIIFCALRFLVFGWHLSHW